MFFDLIEIFKHETKDLSVKLPRSKAHSLKVKYYAFVRALENDIEKFKKEKDTSMVMLRKEQATIARTRGVYVEPDLTSTDDTHFVIFKHRGNDETMLSVLNQLETQIERKSQKEIDLTTESAPAAAAFLPSEGEGYNIESLINDPQELQLILRAKEKGITLEELKKEMGIKD